MTRKVFWVSLLLLATTLISTPAGAIVVLSHASNVATYIGQPFTSIEFENPLTGNEQVMGRQVLDWQDADYRAGIPPWYDDWTVGPAGPIDGNKNEIWLRQPGQFGQATTAIPSNTVSVHLVADNNDGIAAILVDGIEVCRADMGAPNSTTLVVLVKYLAYQKHIIQVLDVAAGQYGDDVHIAGTAALGEGPDKWSQPALPPDSEVGPFYYGWNQPSFIDELSIGQIAADDWVCTTTDPVTDIHWWGSFIGWNGKDPPPTAMPSYFRVTIWTDVPKSIQMPFSHPGQKIWEFDTPGYACKFVGWDFDPRTKKYEACFKFDYTLQPSQYFQQEPGEHIYWVSIAAVNTTGTLQYMWGWKTRPRDPVSLAPDCAVIGSSSGTTWTPLNNQVVQGDEWDLAFQLTTGGTTETIKYEQPPQYIIQPDPQLKAIYGWDDPSNYQMGPIVADDWPCIDPRPISDIHWWGSYVGWMDKIPPPSAPDAFYIAIWTDMPVGPLPYSHPQQLIKNWIVTRSMLNEQPVAMDFDPRTGMYADMCFKYDFNIPDGQWFQQGLGNNIYWLSISAIYNAGVPQWMWGWKTRPKMFMDDAVRIFAPLAPHLGSLYGYGEPIEYPQGISWDMTFQLTSKQTIVPGIKWDQPPQEFIPTGMFYGWDEKSVYGRDQIVADDWRCNTNKPVTRVEWWGSFLNWNESIPPESPMFPKAFHIAFWEDVPKSPDNLFSHPKYPVWEIVADSFATTFAGWDYDPMNTGYQFWETCFHFQADLPPDKWFYQHPLDGDHIYWVSIAAIYDFVDTQYPFGWKTRPHFFMDDAVRIFEPTAPLEGMPYVFGAPIEFPAGTSWDTSFVLGTRKAQISGKITLGDYSWTFADPIQVTVRLTDSIGNLSYRTVYVDATGSYTIENVDPETYQVAFKASHWLWRAVNGVIVIDQDIGPIDVSLINGDVVDNNEVDFDDINATRNAYGSFPGDTNWNERADVDGTGEVDFTDINIVRKNYGEIGD